jgi:hypothetical protein
MKHTNDIPYLFWSFLFCRSGEHKPLAHAPQDASQWTWYKRTAGTAPSRWSWSPATAEQEYGYLDECTALHSPPLRGWFPLRHWDRLMTWSSTHCQQEVSGFKNEKKFSNVMEYSLFPVSFLYDPEALSLSLTWGTRLLLWGSLALGTEPIEHWGLKGSAPLIFQWHCWLQIKIACWEI